MRWSIMWRSAVLYWSMDLPRAQCSGSPGLCCSLPSRETSAMAAMASGKYSSTPSKIGNALRAASSSGKPTCGELLASTPDSPESYEPYRVASSQHYAGCVRPILVQVPVVIQVPHAPELPYYSELPDDTFHCLVAAEAFDVSPCGPCTKRLEATIDLINHCVVARTHAGTGSPRRTD